VQLCNPARDAESPVVKAGDPLLHMYGPSTPPTADGSSKAPQKRCGDPIARPLFWMTQCGNSAREGHDSLGLGGTLGGDMLRGELDARFLDSWHSLLFMLRCTCALANTHIPRNYFIVPGNGGVFPRS
jgi:hypothetical protein